MKRKTLILLLLGSVILATAACTPTSKFGVPEELEPFEQDS